MSDQRPRDAWPGLPLEAWRDTYATLHMWTQIVGKIRLALAPMVNQWWHVTLYVTAAGSPPRRCRTAGELSDRVRFHRSSARDQASDGGRSMPLEPCPSPSSTRSWRARKARCRRADLRRAGRDPGPIPFEEDREHASYDPVHAHRFWRVLVIDKSSRIPPGFIGKASPVHFFWGSFDLAVTRFSGRPAPPHPGGGQCRRRVTREAYSHEVSSCGFWPGARLGEPAFYSYAYPEPPGYDDAAVKPDGAFYSRERTSSFFPTISPAGAQRRSRRCCNSSKAPTQRRRISGTGLARPWNELLDWVGRQQPTAQPRRRDRKADRQRSAVAKARCRLLHGQRRRRAARSTAKDRCTASAPSSSSLPTWCAATIPASPIAIADPLRPEAKKPTRVALARKFLVRLNAKARDACREFAKPA